MKPHRQGTRHRLEGGTIAFRWNGCGDVRGYLPPKGFAVVAELVEHHPATGAFLGESQWWIFLSPVRGGALNKYQTKEVEA